MTNDTDTIEIETDDLRELYSTLYDATMAQARGEPNECARLAREAKNKVLEMHPDP